jgi:hypothetical protein
MNARTIVQMRDNLRQALRLAEDLDQLREPHFDDLMAIMDQIHQAEDPILETLFPDETDEEKEAKERRTKVAMVTTGVDRILERTVRRAISLAKVLVQAPHLSILFYNPDGRTGAAQLFKEAADELLARAPKS